MLVRHSITYVLSRVAAGVLGIVTTGVLTQVLGPQRYGVYSVAFVTMLLVANVGFDWLGPTFLRLREGRREPGVFATFFYLYLVLVVLSGVAVAVLAGLGVFGAETGAVLIGAGLAWVYSWFELITQYEVANLRPQRYLAMMLLRSVLILGLAGGAAWLTHDPVWAAAFTGVGMLGGGVIGTFRKEPLAPSAYNKSLAREAITFGAPVALTFAMLGLMNNGARALLGVLTSTAELGLYTAVFVLVQQSLILLASGFGSAGYSLAVQALETGDQETARRRMLDHGVLLLAVIAPACLGMALTAKGFAALVLGRDYLATAAVITPWMAVGAFLYAIRAYYFDLAFHLGKRPMLQTHVAIVAAIVSLGLGALLIPRFGALGAASAVTVASAVGCAHSFIAGRPVFRLIVPFDTVARVAVCCAVMALAVIALPSEGTLGFVLQVAVGAVAYAAAAVALNVLNVRTRLIEQMQSLQTAQRNRSAER